MAHYAYINENNIVTKVIVGKDEEDLPEGISSWESYFSQASGLRCLRTSYNTKNNNHLTGGVPFRGNFAGIGFSYDEALDAFYPPKPFPSWGFDENILNWAAPTPAPASDNFVTWDEESLSWLEV